MVLTEYYTIMSIRKTLFSALTLFLFLSCLSAQNTNSPYSRYGFGVLENPALGKTRAMGGIGYGIRDKGLINPLNPASYSSVDTLNFIFDFGVSTSRSVFKENGLKQVNPNGKFDYVVMKVPLKKYWGMAFGLMPYSNVGYSISQTYNTGFGDVDYTRNYVGTGGLNTLFFGSGISLGQNLSLGANIKYVFGQIAYQGNVIYSNTIHNSYYESETWTLGTPSIDLGLQYQKVFNKKNKAIFGASFSNASSFKMSDVSSIKIVPTNKDTTTSNMKYDFGLPNTVGIGASYTYDNRLTVGIDYQNQAWSKTAYKGVKDTLANNSRLSLGLEYAPALIPTSYLQAVKYRCGMQYTDSYFKFADGTIKNIGVSVGFGLPLRGQKSALNFAFEAGRLLLPNTSLISENYYKVSFDVSFNELWFFKRKL